MCGRLKAVDQAADLLRQYEQQEKMERQWASQMEAEARHRQQEEERLRVSTYTRSSDPLLYRRFSERRIVASCVKCDVQADKSRALTSTTRFQE